MALSLQSFKTAYCIPNSAGVCLIDRTAQPANQGGDENGFQGAEEALRRLLIDPRPGVARLCGKESPRTKQTSRCYSSVRPRVAPYPVMVCGVDH